MECTWSGHRANHMPVFLTLLRRAAEGLDNPVAFLWIPAGQTPDIWYCQSIANVV